MRSLFRLRWLASTILLIGLSVRPVDAAMVLTLNDPNPTITLQSSSFEYEFRGSFDMDSGYSVVSTTMSWVYQDGPAPPLETTQLVPSPSPNVALFRVAIPPTAAVGLYSQDNLGGRSQYTVNLRNDAGDARSLSVNFTVNLISGVPEPSAWVSASIALAAAVGLEGRRRFRRR